jgi:uncharacterized protein
LKRLWKAISTREAAPPWSLWAALGAVVVSFTTLLMGAFVAWALLGDRQYTALVAWTLGAVVIVAFVYIRFAKPEERAALRLGGNNSVPLQQIFLLLLIGVGLSVTLDVVSGWVTKLYLPDPELQPLYADVLRFGQPASIVSLVVALAFMAIAQPIAEEVVFRGILLPSARASIGAWPGYIGSAILYAGFHALAYPSPVADVNGIWFGEVLPFIAALIFGAVRLYTGSTRAAILTHIGFGLFAVVKLLTLMG